jgi:hypothetical protein
MVIGIDKFKEFFKDYPDSYIAIGGTACDRCKIQLSIF